MSLMFAAVALFSGVNLLFVPFLPEPALWGVILAAAFIIINVVSDKMRLQSGLIWCFWAVILMAVMLGGVDPGDELRILMTVFAFLASAWYSVVKYRKEKISVPDNSG